MRVVDLWPERPATARAGSRRLHGAEGQERAPCRPAARPKIARVVGLKKLAIVGTCVVVATTSGAPDARADETHELRHDLALDASLTGAGILGVVAFELFKDTLGPRQCRWCDRRADGDDALNVVDSLVRDTLGWHDQVPPQRISNVTAFLLEPATSIATLGASALHDGAGKHYPLDLLLVLEAATASTLVNEIVKFSFARERPFVHVLPEEEKPKQAHFSDNNLSFYSGHTSLSFAIATASGTVASLRGYRLAPMVWSTLLPIAAFTGYLRIAGARHYFTDVVGGALLGGAIGALVPLLFHGRTGEDAPNPGELSSPGPGASSRTMQVSFGGAF